MKTLRMSIPVLFMLMAGIIFSSCASKKALLGKGGVSLEYQLKNGEKFTISSTSIVDSEMDQMGQIIISTINGKSVDNYVVLSKDETGGSLVEMEYVERVQDVSSDQGSASTDFGDLPGKKVQFTVLKNGEVKNIKGLENLPEITTLDGTTTTSDTYKMGLEALFINFPEKSLKKGDTWVDDQDTDVPVGDYKLKVTGKTTFTILGEEEKDGFKCIKIGIVGISNLSGEFEQNGMLLGMKRETKTTGNMFFAPQKGMYVHIDSEAKADGIISVESMGMEFPQTNITKSTVSVKFK